jgi:hypothetical protein
VKVGLANKSLRDTFVCGLGEDEVERVRTDDVPEAELLHAILLCLSLSHSEDLVCVGVVIWWLSNIRHWNLQSQPEIREFRQAVMPVSETDCRVPNIWTYEVINVCIVYGIGSRSTRGSVACEANILFCTYNIHPTHPTPYTSHASSPPSLPLPLLRRQIILPPQRYLPIPASLSQPQRFDQILPSRPTPLLPPDIFEQFLPPMHQQPQVPLIDPIRPASRSHELR